jgi:O-antigen/teichoic acid export membrane protein
MKRRSLSLNLLVSWLAHGVGLVVGFFLMPYVLRTLGDRSYGTWIFISSFASYAGLMYVGFGSTISRFVATYHAEKNTQKLRELFTVTLTIYGGMGLLALSIAAGLAAAAPWLNEWKGIPLWQVRAVFLILGLNVALGMAGSVCGGVLHGIQRFDLERGIAITSDFVRIFLTIGLLNSDYGLVTLAAIFLAITIFENSLALYLALKSCPELRFGPKYLRFGILNECLGFSIYAFVGNLASQLIYASSSILIGCLRGAEAIVPFYVALRLTDFLRKPILQIGEVLMPKAGQLQALSDRKAQQRLIERGLLAAFALCLGLYVGTIYFGDDLIRNWVGAGYADSHNLLLILFGAQVIALPLGVVRSILFGMGKVRLPSLLYLCEAVCVVGLSLALIGPYELYGVAWGTAIPLAVFELCVLLPYVIRTLKLDPLHMVRATVLPLVVPLAALWGYSHFVNDALVAVEGWPRLFAVAAGGGAVLAIVGGLQWLAIRPARVPAGPVAGPMELEGSAT